MQTHAEVLTQSAIWRLFHDFVLIRAIRKSVESAVPVQFSVLSLFPLSYTANVNKIFTVLKVRDSTIWQLKW